MPNPFNEFFGCFPTLARANHDCSPNANYYFSFPNFVGQFWAVRDIAKDEEITIGYCDLLDRRSERQAELQKKYSFTCKCRTCTLPRKAASQSDGRRREIKTLIETFLQGPSKAINVERIRKVAGLATQEGLTAHSALVYFYGGKYHLECGAHFNLVNRLLTEAENVFRKVEGGASYNLKKIERLLNILESTVYGDNNPAMYRSEWDDRDR